MITKLQKIKNLGLVFSNYSWDISLPSFKRFNLIYGWNGSGKTTLSRLFDAVSGVSVTDLEYEIEDDAGIKYKQGNVFPKKIRVFNQEYIQKNVKILESRVNSISILLGEENKELIEKIEEDRKLLNGDPTTDPPIQGKISQNASYLADKDRKSSERNIKFTEIAKTIGAAIGGSALRDYRKPQAERDFLSLTEKAELTGDELAKYSLAAKQESLPEVYPLVLKKIPTEGGTESEIPALIERIIEDANLLLLKTVKSEVISRLASNVDISDWVEQGFHLHKKHAVNVCEYCLQDIPTERIEQLARHFNEADKNLKDNLDVLIDTLKKVHFTIQSLQIPDKARFYLELQKIYHAQELDFESAKQMVLASVEKLAEELKSKKAKTTEALTLESKPSIEDLDSGIEAINKTIATHNKTTSDFEDLKKQAVQKLKFHYLSTIFDEVKNLDSDITKRSDDIRLLEVEISDIQKRITENMTKVSSQHKACDDINTKLATFLGRQELTFIPHTKKEAGENGEEKEVVTGYHIMRGNVPAMHLSEGEKTAIAFVYFVVHLGDQDFNVKDGIIVIDDPISSLDSNSLYQAFSFLKNAVKDGKQVFILTHNFDFLKLLINWRRNAGGAGYYMIKNNFPNNVRCAYIGKMDKELCDYESEYHYLFKILKQLRDEQDDSIARAYPVPNIARKVWDTFLMFSVPNGEKAYKKMDVLKAAGFDEQKLDAIYKFTNDQSHITGSGFDPALVPETKKVVKELFEMIEKISPSHFKIIDQATN